jgi:hypothetical protein
MQNKSIEKFPKGVKMEMLLKFAAVRACCRKIPIPIVMDSDDKFVIRPLQSNDLPFLVALEETSFSPNEAATPEKVFLSAAC